jgi:hypothetical protein
MAMILKNVDRMTREHRTEITVSAQSLRTRFGVESSRGQGVDEVSADG